MASRLHPPLNLNVDALTIDRPYLTRIDDSPVAVMTALQWAKYLADNFGLVEARTYLDYYERLGWISPTVTYEMARYMHRFADKEYDPNTSESETSPFASRDTTELLDAHAASLYYISKLTDDDIGQHLSVLNTVDSHPDLSYQSPPAPPESTNAPDTNSPNDDESEEEDPDTETDPDSEMCEASDETIHTDSSSDSSPPDSSDEPNSTITQSAEDDPPTDPSDSPKDESESSSEMVEFDPSMKQSAESDDDNEAEVTEDGTN